MSAEPRVGDPAPDFSLPGTSGTTYSLAEQRGKPDDLAQFTELGTTLWAISPQSVESHDGFSERQGLGFPLLADVGKATFRAYGCLGPLGFPRRSVFVIDREGIVRYCHRAGAGLTFRKTDELVTAVKATL